MWAFRLETKDTLELELMRAVLIIKTFGNMILRVIPGLKRQTLEEQQDMEPLAFQLEIKDTSELEKMFLLTIMTSGNTIS